MDVFNWLICEFCVEFKNSVFFKLLKYLFLVVIRFTNKLLKVVNYTQVEIISKTLLSQNLTIKFIVLQ